MRKLEGLAKKVYALEQDSLEKSEIIRNQQLILERVGFKQEILTKLDTALSDIKIKTDSQVIGIRSWVENEILDKIGDQGNINERFKNKADQAGN